MVSRRTFFSITVMMLVVLCLFMAPQIITDGFKVEYNRGNSHLQSDSAWTQPEKMETGDSYVMFVGNKKGDIHSTVKQWCDYTKQPLCVLETLPAVESADYENITMIVLESEALQLNTDIKRLETYLEMGTTVVFADLPNVNVMNTYMTLRDLLGIKEIHSRSVTVDGIHLYEGFLLGGEMLYMEEEETEDSKQDLQLTMPWYCLGAGSQMFMVGELEGAGQPESELKREELPVVIWSHTNGKGKVYAVNGNYMQDATGVGILSAMVADAQQYMIYPVVNAQVLTLANYPGMADENTEVMKNEFNASMTQVNRDVLFPELSAMSSLGDFSMTCMVYPQYDYADDAEPNVLEYSFYKEQMKQSNGELGMSLIHKGTKSLSEKISRDHDFWNDVDPERKTMALYAASSQISSVLKHTQVLGEIQTIVSSDLKNHPIVSYVDRDITLQNTTADVYNYTYSEDLRNRSLETALAYANVLFDMNRVLWPEDGEVDWIQAAKKIKTNLSVGWMSFQMFEDTTATEANQKVREFLSMDYEYDRMGDTITVTMKGTEAGSFVLRTHGESIKEIQGASWTKLEKDAFLICAESNTIQIMLQKDSVIHQ